MDQTWTSVTLIYKEAIYDRTVRVTASDII